MRYYILFAFILIFFSCGKEKTLDSPLTIFESGTEGYACFRIPAIISSGKTVLAFAEGRKGGCSDTGDIDLVLKRSSDGGKTW